MPSPTEELAVITEECTFALLETFAAALPPHQHHLHDLIYRLLLTYADGVAAIASKISTSFDTPKRGNLKFPTKKPLPPAA